MNKYRVKVTTDALAQMQATTRYIAAELQAPDTARKWLATMKKEIATLSSMPTRIPLTTEEPWHSQGIHRMLIQNFFAYFWIDEEKKCVWVIAVIYARADQAARLAKMGI